MLTCPSYRILRKLTNCPHDSPYTLLSQACVPTRLHELHIRLRPHSTHSNDDSTGNDAHDRAQRPAEAYRKSSTSRCCIESHIWFIRSRSSGASPPPELPPAL